MGPFISVLIIQVSLYAKAPFGTMTKCGLCRCPYFQVPLFSSAMINRFHCIRSYLYSKTIVSMETMIDLGLHVLSDCFGAFHVSTIKYIAY